MKLFISIPAILLLSCASLSRYNMSFSNESSKDKLGGLSTLDVAVDILAQELELRDLMPYSSTIELVSQGFLFVRVEDLPFKCAGGWVAGCLDEYRIIIGMREENSCLGKSAFMHELTHWLLCQRNLRDPYKRMDCDLDHLRSEWWHVADYVAPKRFMEEVCQDHGSASRELIESANEPFPESIISPSSIWRHLDY